MAITTTTNLGLSKPDYDAVADVAVLNNNSDTIDAMFDGTHLVESVNGVAPVSGGAVTIDLGVTSVNGQTGAVTITERSVKQLIDIIYPVGTYYETTDTSFDPNVSWSGTTWTKITDGRVLIAGGGDYTVGNNYGAKTHSITTSELPSHNHTATTASNGAHTHTANSAGNHNHWTMNDIHTASFDRQTAGANVGHTDIYYGDDGRYNGGWKNAITSTGGAHTHSTTSAGAHTHAITVGKTGSGTAMSLVQPSKAVARWLRTA